ncbi:MAG: ABC transporter permease [Ruminococcus sp.]|nr:ABC transporter permease [Ruminococcus sp.]
MTCAENAEQAFSHEKTDVGIYKAIGSTSSRLRQQFAVRHFIVSLIGGAIGSVFGAFFSESLLEVIFRLFGVSKLNTSPTIFTFLAAVAFVSVCVLVFSYVVSRRVKHIDVRELITE